nr:replication factor A protein 1-like [Ipomoea batatas]
MAPMYVLVEVLQKHHTTIAIRLRVVHTYNVLHSRGRDQIKSRECVFDDEAGSYIHMYIPGKSVSPLNDFVEGNAYCIKKFLVVAHWYCYKTCHSGEVKICSSYDATNLLFNQNTVEFVEFRESLCMQQQTPFKSITSNSTFSYGTTSRGDLSSSKMQITTLSEIFTKREIIGIESDPNDWYYDSCPQQNCNKKLEFKSGMYDCGKCGGWFIKGNLRYKLKIHVVDVNGTAPLLLWDHEVLELLCVKADELKAMQPSVMTKIPKDIRNLKGRCLFFKLVVRSDQFDNLNNAVPVMQVKHFPEMFENYYPGLIKHNDDEFCSKLQLTEDDSDSDEVFFSDDPTQSPIGTASGKPNVAVNETEAVKRSLLDEFSSTQTSKKKKQIVVKEEKNEKEPTGEQ